MKCRKLVVTILAVSCVICSGGCWYLVVGAAGAGLGVGTYKFVRGELDVACDAGYDKTWSSTLAALDELGLGQTSAKKDAFSGQIQAERADGTKIKITVTPVTETSTSVKIRVGTLGNRDMSAKIAAEIEKQLGK